MTHEEVLQVIKEFEDLQTLAISKTKEILSAECSKNASSQTALIKMVLSPEFKKSYIEAAKELSEVVNNLHSSTHEEVGDELPDNVKQLIRESRHA